MLADLVTLRDLKQGEVLAREGTVDNHLYVILSGTLGVVKNAGSDRRGDDQHARTPAISSASWDSWTAPSSTRRRWRSATTRVLGARAREARIAAATRIREIVYRVMRAIIRVVHQIQRRLSMQQVELSNYIYKQHGRY